MAHGSNDGHVVQGFAIVVIIYNIAKHQKGANRFDLPALTKALAEMVGDSDLVEGRSMVALAGSSR